MATEGRGKDTEIRKRKPDKLDAKTSLKEDKGSWNHRDPSTEKESVLGVHSLNDK